MRDQLFVSFNKDTELHFYVSDEPVMAHDAARAWLDAQFVAFDCEPLRASGKLLNADKILRVTEAAGPDYFKDEKWASEYVRAVHASFGKPMIRVDVSMMAVSF